MKILKSVVVLACTAMAMSCGGGISKQSVDAAGFGAMEDEIKSKFGDNAYYTDLKVVYIKGIGSTISTTVTEEPESLKMGQWDLAQNTWTQRSEITL
ncbi:hypothetical protein, partial [Aurantibacter sp.]|uniref:hypothetical protein n=1 Tax=Aurantibacter sp. TaxID=2807103 RepID=UPI00326532BB